jgi:hypothetical protein
VNKLKVIGPRQAHAQFADKSRTVTLANYDIAMSYMMFLLITLLMKYRKIVCRPCRRSHRRVWVRSYLRKRRAAGTMRGIMNELSETYPSGFIKYTRMDMTKFRKLVEMVRSAVQKKDKNMRLLISVENNKL